MPFFIIAVGVINVAFISVVLPFSSGCRKVYLYGCPVMLFPLSRLEFPLSIKGDF